MFSQKYQRIFIFLLNKSFFQRREISSVPRWDTKYTVNISYLLLIWLPAASRPDPFHNLFSPTLNNSWGFYPPINYPIGLQRWARVISPCYDWLTSMSVSGVYCPRVHFHSACSLSARRKPLLSIQPGQGRAGRGRAGPGRDKTSGTYTAAGRPPSLS